ncbi:hypothetical protein [Streptomyces sp. NWU339]|uniref:hypothetical protein n=1 Tax=Streptomyces sp. NWU339 TaxID=2185284 RepID=UPI00268BC4B1|nr:hypothetical protein [Streptomyces sp. NWU339]
MTIQIGLGIGGVVFRALNLVELALAATTLVAVAAGGAGTSVVVLAVVVALAPAARLGVIRPRLDRRSDRVLAGEQLPRSHWYYVAFEAVKAVALLALGILLLTV